MAIRSTLATLSTTPQLIAGSVSSALVQNSVVSVPGDAAQVILVNYSTVTQILLSGQSAAAAGGLFVLPPSTAALSGTIGTQTITVPLRSGDDIWGQTTAGTATVGIFASRQPTP